MASGDFDPQRLLRVLHSHQVRFVLVGGMAAILHGDVAVTLDLDIVPEHRADNLVRLAEALRALHARVRASGIPDGLPFDCSPQFLGNLASDSMLNLTTSAGDIDLMFQPSGTQGYADLRRNAVELELAPRLRVVVADLADVIRSKEAAGREKDRVALPRLRTLLGRLQEERGHD